MLNNLNIKKKILASVLSINFIILIIIFAVYYSFSKDILLSESLEKAQSKVQEVAKTLEGHLNEKAKIVKVLNENPQIQHWMENNTVRYADLNTDKEYRQFKRYIQRLNNNDPDIAAIFYAQERTQMYYDTEEQHRVGDDYIVGKRPWYIQTKASETGIYDVDIDIVLQLPLISYRLPIRVDGKFLGVGGIDINFKSFGEFLAKTKLFESGKIMIVDSKTRFLYHPDNSLILKESLLDDKYKNGSIYEGVPILVNLIQSNNPGKVELVYNNDNRYFFSVPLKGIGWTMLLSVSSSEINEPLTSLSITSIFIFVGSLIILLFATLYIANSISKPIIKLSDAVIDAAEKGRLSIDTDVKTKDEIGELLASLRNMMQQIRDKANVAEQISMGNLNVEVDIISNEDTLGHSMQTMKDSIRKLVNDSEKLAHAAAEGDLKYRADTSQHQGEYKKILDQINMTIDSLLHSIKDASEVLQLVANKDLSARMTGNYKGDHAALKETLNTAIENLDHTLQQVSETLESHFEAANQISSLTEEIALGIDKQSYQTGEVATAIEEMTSTILETSNNAAIMSDTAEKSRKSAEEGGNVVIQTINGMQSIAEKVNQSAEVVETLGKSSEEIGEIISVINDIADQTNLLALNAAIEAARAGEQGRGFAVVADEVRKLAERTTKATKEIEDMISKIQHDTTDAVASMSQGTNETSKGIELADRAGEALEQIVNISQEVTEKVIQIATASEEQHSVSLTISQNVEEINSISQQTASGMMIISQNVEDFKDLTERLKKLNNSFKLTKSKNNEYLH